MRFGPWSRVIWWVVTAIVLWAITSLMGLQPDTTGRFRSIWSFLVIPVLGVALFPIAYFLDRVFTPGLRRAWAAWRLSRTGR